MPVGDGSTLGQRYRLLSLIGRGGMGAVWHAHDDLLDRDVAVKEVRYPPGLSDADRAALYERTMREARSAARLTHPGIVTVHDVVEEDGRPCIVMELLRAKSLQDLLDEGGTLTPVQAAEIGAQTLAALRAAHQEGIVHRDVKPANVMLSGDRSIGHETRVVITDFGIARAEGDATLTRTGQVMGSPAYIAPERIRGGKAVPASDLWALGATLYAACEGRPPHERTDAMSTLTAVLNEEPAPPSRAGPLTPVLLGMLTRDLAMRMRSEDAADALGRIARAGHPDPSETIRDPRVQRAPRRGRGLIIVAVAVVACVATAVTLLLVNTSGRASGRPPAEHESSPQVASRPPAPPSAPAVPAGFVRSVGPQGARLVVPVGWARRVVGGSTVQWIDPATGAHVQVDSIPWGVADPVEHWQRFRVEVVQRGTLPGFRFVRLGPRFSARGWQAADLEYTWRSRRGRLHARDRGITAGGRQYAILVAAPVARWPAYAGYMDVIFGSFRPGS